MVSMCACSALVEVSGRGDYTPQLKSPVGLTPDIISPSEDPSEEIPGSVRNPRLVANRNLPSAVQPNLG
jgi:hypothetical protein